MCQNKTEFSQEEYDLKIINYALNLSKKNIGLCAKNPSVAAIITKDNSIIATGITGKNGSPHAEIAAINKIKDKTILKQCQIYVTLEPCSHQGQNPPCVDAIIKYQFRRVIIANIDPNPLVNNQGINKLKQANIEVSTNILSKKGQEINKRFFKAITTKLPYVTLKLACSLDSKIACFNNDSKWISNESSRQLAHLLRSQNDAILIGKNTLIKDQPRLNCRTPGLEDYSPQIIIFTSSDLSDSDTKNLHSKPLIINPKENLKNSLNKLTKSGINSILIEGGAMTSTKFLQENLVDEIIIFRSNKIIGGDGISMFDNLGINNVKAAINNFKRVKIKEFGNDIVEILTNQQS